MVAGKEQLFAPDRSPTLRFGPQDGQFNGMGGCNSYGGTYTLTGDTFHVNNLYYTQVACWLTAQETAYFQAFPRVARYHLARNTPTLTSSHRTALVTFPPS